MTGTILRDELGSGMNLHGKGGSHWHNGGSLASDQTCLPAFEEKQLLFDREAVPGTKCETMKRFKNMLGTFDTVMICLVRDAHVAWCLSPTSRQR